jgi:hypothetical protein
MKHHLAQNVQNIGKVDTVSEALVSDKPYEKDN